MVFTVIFLSYEENLKYFFTSLQKLKGGIFFWNYGTLCCKGGLRVLTRDHSNIT